MTHEQSLRRATSVVDEIAFSLWRAEQRFDRRLRRVRLDEILLDEALALHRLSQDLLRHAQMTGCRIETLKSEQRDALQWAKILSEGTGVGRPKTKRLDHITLKTTTERLEWVRQQEAASLKEFWRRVTSGGDYKVSYEGLRKYHRGRTAPADYLSRVAGLFDVRLDWLVNGTGHPLK